MFPSIRRRRPSRLIAALACLTVLIGASTACEPPTPTHARAHHVVLVGFDGFDPAYLGRVPTPNLDALAARGAHGTAYSVEMPYTAPAFAAITTGAWPVHSGVITDYWDRATGRYVKHSPDSKLTTIAQHVRNNGGTVAAVHYSSLPGHGVRNGDPNALYAPGGTTCSERFDDAISIIERRPVLSGSSMVTVPRTPDFLAVYCSELDDIGHAEGAESPRIATALATLDAQIGRLLDTLAAEGIAEDTTVIVTGDHGMSSYTGFVAVPILQALQAHGYHMTYVFQDGQQIDPDTDVVVVPFGGRGVSVYPVGRLAGDEAALADLRSILESLPQISAVRDRADQQAMFMHPDYGDLVAEPAPGWGDDLPVNGPLGGHGTQDELDTVYVAGGAGIRQVAGSGTMFLVNVGPTIAYLLGLGPLPDADAGPAFDLLTPDPAG